MNFKGMNQELTGSAGLLESSAGLHFAKSLGFSGIRIESNRDLLFRDRQLQGSEIEIFLPRHARVEIFRNSRASGEILYSRMLDFGTVQIDTRQFPEGSYNIEIVTTDDTGAVTRDTRPFTKSTTLAPRGQPVIDMELGTVRRNNLDISGREFLGLSYRRRLFDWLEGALGTEATKDDQVYETSLSSQKNLSLFKSMGLLNMSLTGAIAKLGKLAGFEGSLGWSDQKHAIQISAGKTYNRPDINSLPDSLALTDREALDINFSTPIKLGDKLVFGSFSGEISDSSNAGKAYRYGPSFTRALGDFNGYHHELKLDYTVTDKEQRAMATLTIRSRDPVWTKSGELSARREGTELAAAARADMGFAGEESGYKNMWKDVDANAYLRTDPLISTKNPADIFAGGQASYKAAYAKFLGSVDQNLSRSTGQMTGELDSTALWTPDAGLRATSQAIAANTALLILKLNGPAGTAFGITVDNATRAYGKGGDTVIVPLPAYAKVHIRAFQKEGDDSLQVKEKEFAVIGFPGNVIYREFHILKTFFLMGTLVDETGKALPNERFTYEDQILYSDENGLFTLESPAEAGKEEKFETTEGSCSFTIAKLPQNDVLADLGKVACKPRPRPQGPGSR